MSQTRFNRRQVLGVGVIVGTVGTTLGVRAVLADYHEEEEATQAVGAETQVIGSTPEAAIPGATPGASPAAAAVVEVELTEYEIRMPDELPAGPTTFEVTNVGTVEHNFEVEGQGIEREFEQNLQPGETGTLQVDLAPGTYEVYCPVADHAEQGMRLELNVTELASGPSAPGAGNSLVATLPQRSNLPSGRLITQPASIPGAEGEYSRWIGVAILTALGLARGGASGGVR